MLRSYSDNVESAIRAEIPPRSGNAGYTGVVGRVRR